MFAERGYDRTEIKAIARASGAAVGSITHFLGPKPSLAAKVYEAVSADLLVVIQRGFERGGGYLDRAVPNVIADCYKWRVTNPGRAAVIANQRPIVCPPGGKAVPVEYLLAEALGIFMKDVVDRSQAVAFTPSQYYALILAPVMSAGIHPADPVIHASELWMERLGQMALATLALDNAGKRPAACRTRKPSSSSRLK